MMVVTLIQIKITEIFTVNQLRQEQKYDIVTRKVFTGASFRINKWTETERHLIEQGVKNH